MAEVESPETAPKAEEKPAYVWPVGPAKPKAPRLPTTRVLKIGYVDPDKRFRTLKDGTKQVRVSQFRFPRAEKRWDPLRMKMEMEELGLAKIEDLFPEAPRYCQRIDCWKPAKEGSTFCSDLDAREVNRAHDRKLILT